jgi:MFS family permease
MDTAGAMLGPLVAFGLLTLAPEGYDVVFVVSFCFALIGLAILVMFVDGRAKAPADDRDTESEAVARGQAGAQAEALAQAPAEPAERATVRSALALLGRRRFAIVVGIGTALAIATVSDAFIYLTLQRRLDFDPTLLPLLYVGTALVYMVMAVPAGRLADRYGRPRVFLVGYTLLLAVYGLLLLPGGGIVQLVLCLLLFGGYYAATEGVLMAISSALLPAAVRGTGLALLVTATSLARIVAAIAFGAVWTSAGSNVALIAFAAGLATAIAAAAVTFIRMGKEDREFIAVA